MNHEVHQTDESVAERWTVFTNGEDGYHTIRIPTVVVTPRGTVLAFAEGRRDSYADDGTIDLLLRSSHDGGENWSAIQIVRSAAGDGTTMGNPTPIVDRETGVVALLFCRDNETAYRMISGDEGLTWSEPAEITDAFDGFGVAYQRVATGPVHGIQSSGGRLVAPIWIHRHSGPYAQQLKKQYGNQPEKLLEDKTATRTGVIVSDDHGHSWKAGGLVPATIAWMNEASVFEADDGSLVINSRAHLAGYRAQSVSTDGGTTWSEPELRKDLIDPTCQGSILKLRYGPMAGAVVFSNLDQDRTKIEAKNPLLKRGNLTVRLSRDDAGTFPHRRVIEPGFSGYSDLAQLPDGRVLCLFENGDEVYRERVSLLRFDPAWVGRAEA